MLKLAICFTLFTAWADSLPETKQTAIETLLREWAKGVGEKNVPRIIQTNNKERRKLLRRLNAQLTTQELPKINTLTKLEIRKSCIQGFIAYPDCFDGLEIVDTENRFCLPCIIPHNQVFWLVQDKALTLNRRMGTEK